MSFTALLYFMEMLIFTLALQTSFCINVYLNLFVHAYLNIDVIFFLNKYSDWHVKMLLMKAHFYYPVFAAHRTLMEANILLIEEETLLFSIIMLI